MLKCTLIQQSYYINNRSISFYMQIASMIPLEQLRRRPPPPSRYCKYFLCGSLMIINYNCIDSILRVGALAATIVNSTKVDNSSSSAAVRCRTQIFSDSNYQAARGLLLECVRVNPLLKRICQRECAKENLLMRIRVSFEYSAIESVANRSLLNASSRSPIMPHNVS